MKGNNVGQMLTLLIVLSAFPLFELHADPITIERSITWVKAGDKWDPSQMALVRTEFDGGISYGSKEYVGPQTAQALMNTFDESYNRKHSHTSLTVFPSTSIAKIKQDRVTGVHAWSELLSKEGISTQFTITEIDARYPREAWLHLLLERGATIESLMDYFFCMTHRYQLAFLEDSLHLSETETHGTLSTDVWETYKTNYIDRLVRDYIRNWKTAAEATRKGRGVSKTKAASSKARASSKRSVEHQKGSIELAEMDPQSLQNLVSQLEQIAEDLERQNRWKAAEGVKAALEHVKKALVHDQIPKPSSKEPNRGEKKKSPYPPL